MVNIVTPTGSYVALGSKQSSLSITLKPSSANFTFEGPTFHSLPSCFPPPQPCGLHQNREPCLSQKPPKLQSKKLLPKPGKRRSHLPISLQNHTCEPFAPSPPPASQQLPGLQQTTSCSSAQSPRARNGLKSRRCFQERRAMLVGNGMRGS